MKKTVIGKIIDEGNKSRNTLSQVEMLENVKRSSQDLKQIQLLENQIQALRNQITNTDNIRSNLIKEIQKLTGRKLITYFSINSFITDRDSKILEDYFISNKITSVDILLDSPGGFTDSAEKLIKICRMRTGNDLEFDFRTIVINRAKSAATLFALGSSKVLLGSTAELGPVDPQIGLYAPNGEQVRDSAHQIYYGAKEYLDNTKRRFRWNKGGDQIMLSKYDPIVVKRSQVAISHTADIIAKRIYTNPYLILGYDTDKDVRNDLKIFTEHEVSHSHGRPIYFEDISESGFVKNKFIQKLSDHYLNDEKIEEEKFDLLEKLLWELTIRSLEVVRPNSEPIIQNNQIVGNRRVSKTLFESENGLIITSD